jgi:hypothetical protein
MSPRGHYQTLLLFVRRQKKAHPSGTIYRIPAVDYLRYLIAIKNFKSLP